MDIELRDDGLPVDEHLRAGIAGRKDAPRKMLDILSKDDNKDVRFAAADNPSCPAGALERLAGDGDEWVRQAAAGNPSLPLSRICHLHGPSDTPEEQSLVDSLSRLGELHDSGVLSDEEFVAAKRKLLDL